MNPDYLTTAEVAARLKLTVRAVQKMIEHGRLEARQFGRDYMIAPEALENIPRDPRGRKPKAAKAARQRRQGE